jgi:ABC transporter with metal-binding/Fe-S-binding domain ATP-binding protein
MRLAALFSGGKDSVLAAYLMEQQGHSVDVLVSVRPRDPHSWVFHTPNLKFLPLMAEAMNKELVAVDSTGTERDDLRALEDALSLLEVDGVITGAIASDYQWDRINHVCEGLDLNVHSPLWRKDQDLLMEELIDAGVVAMIVSVSADGLDASWLGKRIDHQALDGLRSIAKSRGMNLAGEGGEYETLVLDSPLHRRAIRILGSEVESGRDSGLLKVTRAMLEDKK